MANNDSSSSAHDKTKDKTVGMKSAYELALERLERQGIERPREDALSDEVRAQIAEVRSKAEAELAQLEIMHRQTLAKAGPGEVAQLEEEYVRERRRIEERREARAAQLRGA